MNREELDQKMVRRIVNLRVLIDSDDEFDIDDLILVIREEHSRSLLDPNLLPENEVYFPETNYCEIIEYLHVYEEDAEGYE